MAKAIEVLGRSLAVTGAILPTTALYAQVEIQTSPVASFVEGQRINALFSQDANSFPLRRPIQGEKNTLNTPEQSSSNNGTLLHLFPEGTNVQQISSKLGIPVPVLETLGAEGMDMTSIMQLTPEKALELANNSCSFYVVKDSDPNLTEIAHKLGIPLQQLEAWNSSSDNGFINVDPSKGGNPNLIHTGDKLYTQLCQLDPTPTPETNTITTSDNQPSGLPQISPEIAKGLVVVFIVAASSLIYYGFKKH